MRRLRKNKKGALGLENIGSTILAILDLIPAPIKILLFLFIIASLGYLFSYVFHLFGIFCNPANEPVKLNSNILSNINLISEIPDTQLINFEAIEAKGCFQQLNNEQITLENGTETNATGKYLLDFGCVQCFNPAQTKNFFVRTNDICLDDTIRTKTEEEKTWYQKISCNPALCEPPVGYVYDTELGAYSCAEANCAGRTIEQDYNDKLQKYNAQVLYPTSDIGSRGIGFEDVLGVTCVDLKPKLAIFKIDLFNYQTMFVLILLAVVFWLWRKT